LTARNYKELAQLYEKYSGKGLEILAMPCESLFKIMITATRFSSFNFVIFEMNTGNQFGGQEPGTNAEIVKFARSKGAKFPVFAKIDVNGENTHPLYVYLKANAPG
jgi:glutathione peroxidase